MKKNIQLSLDNSDFSDKKILIVKTKWNEEIIEPMVEDCMKVLDNHEVNFSTFTVPGAFEIPFMVSKKIGSFDAAITLGAIIKGETPHFDIIAQSVSDQIINLGIEFKKPVIFGVLTTNNSEQAIERAKTKGSELAESALYLLNEIDA